MNYYKILNSVSGIPGEDHYYGSTRWAGSLRYLQRRRDTAMLTMSGSALYMNAPRERTVGYKRDRPALHTCRDDLGFLESVHDLATNLTESCQVLSFCTPVLIQNERSL